MSKTVKSVKEIVITKNQFEKGFILKRPGKHGKEFEVQFSYRKNKNELLRDFAELIVDSYGCGYDNIYAYIIKIQNDPRVGLVVGNDRLIVKKG